jgi:hypothetical protein
VRTKDYWKGRPKLQAWFKSRADSEALRRHFEHARSSGRTRARAPGGWVVEWLISAAAAAARGQFPAQAQESDDYRAALEVVAQRYGLSDQEEAKRLVVSLTARALRSGRDPFAVPLALPELAESRRGA